MASFTVYTLRGFHPKTESPWRNGYNKVEVPSRPTLH